MYSKLHKMLKLKTLFCTFLITFLNDNNYVNSQRHDNWIPSLNVLMQGTYTTSAWSNRTIYQYFNIPFAEPPLGEQYRFQVCRFNSNFSYYNRISIFFP